MALRLYMNGTEGMRDGTPISSGDGTAPLLLDGLYPGTSEVTLTKNICIRGDLGEEWRDVNIGIHRSPALASTDERRVFTTNGGANDGPTNHFFYFFVGDTNRMLEIKARATPADTGAPDTAAKIFVHGWRKA